jgi:prephenate dehydratase
MRNIDIFDAVQSGNVSRGVVPFENSTNGSVVQMLDLFADRSNLYPDVIVSGEAYLDVHHYLLGSSAQPTLLEDSPEISRTSTPTPAVPEPLKPRAAPITSLKHIERLYSHPQAFGQCEIFLAAYLKGIERVDVSSTSKAAELVKADVSGKSAAIASQVASDIHKLDVLAEGIEDREDNTTRFFILEKNTSSTHEAIERASHEKICPSKSLVSFTVDHKAPGALASVLEVFRNYKLNLTSINSRPSRVIPFQYIFFVEFEGSKIQDPEGTVNEALLRLNIVAQSCRWLGSWQDQLK